MSRYRTTTKISTTLLLMTYGMFGWLYASWVFRAIEEERILSQILEPQLRIAILYGVGAIGVVAIAIVFTAPIILIVIGLNGWLKSDLRAFFLVFFGALAFALIIQWLSYIAKFFVLLASAILVKLDLQTMGLNKWLSYFMLALMCIGSFFVGIIAFNYWG